MKRTSFFLGLAGLTAMAGCANAPNPVDQERFAIEVREEPQSVTLSAGAGVGALSAEEKLAIRKIADGYLAKGQGPLLLAQPAKAENDANAAMAAGQARRLLLEAGVRVEDLRETAYDAPDAKLAPVVVSYRHYVAVAPKCPSIAEVNLAMTWSNMASPAFGCTLNANLAAMIADPADLIGPHPIEPADIMRRANVLEKYRKGDPTASAKDDSDRGVISNAVKQ